MHTQRVRKKHWFGSAGFPLGLLVLTLVGIGLSVQAADPPIPPDDPAPEPTSLKGRTIPEPPNLADFVKDKAAAIRLGKALFWDMQVGSDGVTACATCHNGAGVDPRIKNQINPGPNGEFEVVGPNGTVVREDYPFAVDDITGSQGVFLVQFQSIRLRNPVDKGKPVPDPVFNVNGTNVRRVTGRNTPTTINAIFNIENFWDGRAKFHFNGQNPFGELDQEAGIYMTTAGTLVKQRVLVPQASLASQAVGPPLSDVEMSHAGRTWPDVGKKMLTLLPLGKQLVHPHDSVLGKWARTRLIGQGTVHGLPGLRTTYPAMIKAAFRDHLWNSDKIVTYSGKATWSDALGTYAYWENDAIMDKPNRPLALHEFSQMEANFAFFFGLSVQLYEATLVSDDAPFDRWKDGNAAAVSDAAKRGFDLFKGKGRCVNCHNGPEFTSATVAQRLPLPNRIELMLMGNGAPAVYDGGFYNISVRPTAEDLGRGGTAPFENPLTGDPFPLSFSRLALLKRDNLLPQEVANLNPDWPVNKDEFPDFVRVAVDGAFKTSGLRNIELTGPYFHTGGKGTLAQVIDFYDRGGDFPQVNIDNLDPDIAPIGFSPEEEADLLAFLLSLTDERVRQEKAPFDHPQLLVPQGLKGDENQVQGNCNLFFHNGFKKCEEFFEIKPVGAGGRPAAGLPPLGTFLGLDPADPVE